MCSLTAAQRGNIVAALWAARKRDALKSLLEHPEFAHHSTLERAAYLLDIPRRLRALERRLAAAALPQKRRALSDSIAALAAEEVPAAYSLTRSFAKVLRAQLRRVPTDRLEFDLLFFEDGPWKSFCDVTHSHPDQWSLAHFQASVFGAEPPEGSLVADAATMAVETLPTLLERHPTLGKMYSLIRKKIPPCSFDGACRAALGTAVPLADLLWHYEEVAGVSASGRRPLDDAIAARLEDGESLAGGALSTDNFGKLLDRLLVFRRLGVPFWRQLMPLADQLLDELRGRRLALVERSRGGPRPLQSLAAKAVADSAGSATLVPQAVIDSLPREPSLSVAVLGDASASMQVCVNAACISGAMLSAVFDAELVFFNRNAFRATSHVMPRTAEEVLEVTEEVRANYSTSPAAALAEFYQAGKVVDIFILVTDEEENTACAIGDERLSFASLFSRYRREVHAQAQCVFVSFLRSSTACEGPMVADLRRCGIEATFVRYDQERPDLSKFDSLLGSVLHEAARMLDPVDG